MPPEVIAQDVNMFLRGWAAYFRYGHSAQRFSEIRQYARMRLALFISKKHRRSRGFRWRVLVALSPDELGLISLSGIVVAPRAGKPWREKPNAGGEPCAGEPHALHSMRGGWKRSARPWSPQ